ncbi:DNRLRE domain-containing protein, partial [candidate division KSB1 bacterium]|nr:DNRLRE domain-containing protein [candidate division KSB1 bacterium]
MMKTIQTALLLAALMALFCAQNQRRNMWEPSQVSIGVEPNDDAPVKAGADSMTHFGQDKTLTVAHGRSLSYLKFFIPGFSRIDRAVLKVQSKEVVAPGSVAVYPVLHCDWDESQLTWNQRPDIAAEPLVIFKVDQPYTLYEIDLTEQVVQKTATTDYFICLCFKADEQGSDVSFASVEDYDNLKPRFMIDGLTHRYSAPPAFAPSAFVHPGILITAEQIAFVREKIGSNFSPWKEAFVAALSSESVQRDYRPAALDTLTYSGYYGYSQS